MTEVRDTTAELPYSDPSGEGWSGIPAPRLARNLIYVVLGCYFVMTSVNIVSEPLRTPVRCLGIGLLGCVMVIAYAATTPWGKSAPIWAKTLISVVQALLTYVPVTVYGWPWVATGAFMGSTFLLLVPGYKGWILQLVSVSGLSAGAVMLHMRVIDVLYLWQAIWTGGVVVFAIAKLADTVVALFATRADLARVAVSDERLRFSRDLHDLLSSSLSAVILKSEMLRCMIRSHPAGAEAEAREISDTTRQALTDVRTLASDYRQLSLAAECDSARRVLQAARIRTAVSLQPVPDTLCPKVETALATVLREGVANILRHSRARTCSIALHYDPRDATGLPVTLSVVNDGVPRRADRSGGPAGPIGGPGLAGLSYRMDDVDGSVSADVDADGRFRLVARAPAGPGR